MGAGLLFPRIRITSTGHRKSKLVANTGRIDIEQITNMILIIINVFDSKDEIILRLITNLRIRNHSTMKLSHMTLI